MSEREIFLRRVGAEVLIGIALILTVAGFIMARLNQNAVEKAREFMRLARDPVKADENTPFHIPFLYEGIDEFPDGFRRLGTFSRIRADRPLTNSFVRVMVSIAAEEFHISEAQVPNRLELVLFLDEEGEAEFLAKIRDQPLDLIVNGSSRSGRQ